MNYSSLCTLPVDLLRPVVAHLPPFDLVSLWLCGSKRLNATLRYSVRKWRQLDEGAIIKWPRLLSEFVSLNEVSISTHIGGELYFAPQDILTLPSTLETLHLSTSGSLRWATNRDLSAIFPNLRSLLLDPGFSASDEEKNASIACWPPNLTSLGYYRRGGDYVLTTPLPTTLTELRVSGQDFYDRHIVLLPRSLLILDLGTAVSLTKACIKHLPPNLTRLVLRAIHVSSREFCHLPPSLKCLHWSGGEVSRATTLLPSGVKELTVENLEVSEEVLGALPQGLEKFHCAWLKTASEARLSTFFSNNSLLRSLKLSLTVLSGTQVLPSGLTELDGIRFSVDTNLHGLPSSLTRLSIQFIPPAHHIGTIGFDHLDVFSSLTSLKHLYLSSLGECQDPHRSYITLPPNLDSLKVEQQVAHTNAIFARLPNTLTSLIVPALQNLSISGVQELPQSITELSLPQDRAICNDDVPLLPRSITSLILISNVTLTDACIPHLPRRLQILSVSCNPNFSDACLEHLPKSLHEFTTYSSKFSNAAIEKFPQSMGVLKTSAALRGRFYDRRTKRRQDSCSNVPYILSDFSCGSPGISISKAPKRDLGASLSSPFCDLLAETMSEGFQTVEQQVLQGHDTTVPSHMNKLAACRVCALVKSPQQFELDGCNNCSHGETVVYHTGSVDKLTTKNFSGVIAMLKPTESWVSKWQFMKKNYVPGLYAVQVEDRLTPKEAQEEDNR